MTSCRPIPILLIMASISTSSFSHVWKGVRIWFSAPVGQVLLYRIQRKWVAAVVIHVSDAIMIPPCRTVLTQSLGPFFHTQTANCCPGIWTLWKYFWQTQKSTDHFSVCSNYKQWMGAHVEHVTVSTWTPGCLSCPFVIVETSSSHIYVACRSICNRDLESWSAKIVLDRLIAPFRGSWSLDSMGVQMTKHSHTC